MSSSIALNGATLAGSQAAANSATNGVIAVADPNTAVMDIDGTLSFNVAAEPSAPASTSGAVPAGNPLTLQVSGDNYDGDPQIEVLVDGAQVGSSIYTVTADHSSGQWQTITIDGNFVSTVAHQVQVVFTNDDWDGISWWSSGGSADGNDVNVYVEFDLVERRDARGQPGSVQQRDERHRSPSSDPNTAVMDIDGTLSLQRRRRSALNGERHRQRPAAASGTGPEAAAGAVRARVRSARATGSAPSGTGYYVSPTGSDNNPGTLAAPFATLARAQEAMEGSSIKTTYVEGGTYNLGSTLTLDRAPTMARVGTTIRRTASIPPSLNGGGSLQTMIELDANNVTIDGLTIENYGEFGIHHDAARSTLTGITIENCNIGNSTVTGTWQSGAVFIDNVNGITISHNYIYNVQSEGIALFAFNSGNVLDNVNITGNVVLGRRARYDGRRRHLCQRPRWLPRHQHLDHGQLRGGLWLCLVLARGRDLSRRQRKLLDRHR